MRGEVRLVNIDPSPEASQQAVGDYHVLIVSNDRFNYRSGLATVMPIGFSEDYRDHFDAFRIDYAPNIKSPFWVLTDQIRTLSAERIGDYVTALDPDDVRKILFRFFDLVSP